MTTVILVILTFCAADPIYHRIATVYLADPQNLTVRSGLVNRKTRTVRWSAIAAADVEAPWTLRLFGLRRVVLAQAGEGFTQIKMEALARADADRVLAEVVRHARPNDISPDRSETGTDLATDSVATACQPEQADQVPPLYAATLRDLVIASLLLGRFIVYAPVAAAILWDVAGYIGPAARMLENADIPTAVVVLAATATAALGGVVLSVIRLLRFRVTVHPDGTVVVARGFVETKSRTIRASGVQGLVVKANVVEAACGRCRLSLLTLDDQGTLGANVILPSLPRATVRVILDQFFPSLAGEMICPRVSRASWLRQLMCLAVVVFLGFAAYYGTNCVLGRRTVWGLLVAVAAVGISNKVGGVLVSSLRCDATGTVAWVNRELAVRSQTVLHVESIHLIQSRVCFRSSRGPFLTTVFTYAGRPIALSACRCDWTTLEAITRGMSRRSRTSWLSHVAGLRSNRATARLAEGGSATFPRQPIPES
jgi:uncharacterized membrane protein YdbT with pleckstrin-like domain